MSHAHAHNLTTAFRIPDYVERIIVMVRARTNQVVRRTLTHYQREKAANRMKSPIDQGLSAFANVFVTKSFVLRASSGLGTEAMC
jgi:hypothetical protein